MAETQPVCDFGWPAPPFTLKGVDGETRRLADLRGENGAVVAFICNHCPYVKAIHDLLIRDARDLAGIGVHLIAVSSNDVETYPEDSFDNMVRVAREKGFPFPYLFDETQDVARAYGAVCTPDFFGLDRKMGLQYRGRLDASKTSAVPGARRELYEAMKLVAETGRGPEEQIPSMGCSIKWREAG